jgi:hypothetical protein
MPDPNPRFLPPGRKAPPNPIQDVPDLGLDGVSDYARTQPLVYSTALPPEQVVTLGVAMQTVDAMESAQRTLRELIAMVRTHALTGLGGLGGLPDETWERLAGMLRGHDWHAFANNLESLAQQCDIHWNSPT